MKLSQQALDALLLRASAVELDAQGNIRRIELYRAADRPPQQIVTQGKSQSVVTGTRAWGNKQVITSTKARSSAVLTEAKHG